MNSTNTVVGFGLGLIEEKHKSDVLNVLISIGLLLGQDDSRLFPELGLDVRHYILADRQQFSIHKGIGNPNQINLLDVEVTDRDISVNEFKRGLWEKQLEKLSKEGIVHVEEKPKELIRAPRTGQPRKSKGGTPNQIR